MQITQQGTIYDGTSRARHESVACFPSLTRLRDGRIFCAFRVGTAKDSADENIRVAHSGDEGRTWTLLDWAPSTVLDGAPGSFHIVQITETRPNHLLIVGNWMNRSDPTLPISHPETCGVLEMRAVAFRSEDGGDTWSEGEEITSAPFIQPEVSGPVIALAQEGCFALPMENQKLYYDTGPINEKGYVLLSSDYGKTFPEWAMIVHQSGRSYWTNRMARMPVSGRLICFSWTYDEAKQEDLNIHVSYGSPDGKQWSTPQPSGVQGQLSTPLALSDEVVLMGYNHRHQPASIRLRASIDGGATWEGAEELIIYSGAVNAPTDRLGGDVLNYYSYMVDYTFGWNQMVRLNDGSILMAYYAGTPVCMDIRWARIDVSDLPCA